ncbi:hypothetical protein Taro_010767 [Colocasia esculenta]|uniref:Oleosin n=1 Tax=Colocasia esculenta TaxID=4460 RepID=A0A843U4G6_COLES|nr:hypothetical protein [Colocasia esculenta]
MAQRTFMEAEGRPAAGRPGGAAILWATVAGAAVGVPLLGMMGFTFTASLVLLLVASPFLVVSSPLLLAAALVLAASVAGFGAAAAMAVAGVAALTCAARAVGMRVQGPVGRFVETLTESGQRVKQREVDMGDYLQRKALVQPPEGRANQG